MADGPQWRIWTGRYDCGGQGWVPIGVAGPSAELAPKQWHRLTLRASVEPGHPELGGYGQRYLSFTIDGVEHQLGQIYRPRLCENQEEQVANVHVQLDGPEQMRDGYTVDLDRVDVRWSSKPEPPPTPTPSPSPSPQPELSSQEATQWCAQAGCRADQFSPLLERDGSTNPAGRKFDGGGMCYRFEVPAGIQFDYWNGTSDYSAHGPAKLARVCVASFRRSAQPPPPATAPTLSAAEAAEWCAAAGCRLEQFHTLQETNGAVNPAGQKFVGDGACYRFIVPAGVQFDFTDSTVTDSARGAADLSRVCAASFRREP